jgi:predicted transcriptional regulator
MTEKVSEQKVSRIHQLYIEGYSEVNIAKRLKVTQSTVSLYINRLKETVDSQGLEKVSKEYGKMDSLQSLHDLGAELQKGKLTIEEAKTALKVHSLLQGYGIGEDNYGDIILACTKMHSKGFATAAQELANTERNTGFNYQALMQQYHTASENLDKTKNEMSVVKTELQHTGNELSDMEKKRSLAAKELESYLDKVGLDMKRLESVEKLAMGLKKVDVGDAELEGYLNRESLLQKAGISSDIFTRILKQVKVLTEADQGKELLQMLVEYHGLSQSIKEKKMIALDLEKKTSVLEDQRKLVIRTEDKLKELMAERVMLEKNVEDLDIKHNAYIHLQREVLSLSDSKTLLERDNTALVTATRDLSGHIVMLRKELSDLREFEIRHQTLLTQSQDMETKINSSRRQFDMLNAFLGFIDPSSFRQIEEFVGRLPALLADAREKGYSPEVLRDFVLQNIMGQKLRVLRCGSCNANIFIDKTSPRFSMISICPACSGLLEAAWNEADIMKASMNLSQPKQLVPLNHYSGDKVTLNLNKVNRVL